MGGVRPIAAAANYLTGWLSSLATGEVGNGFGQ